MKHYSKIILLVCFLAALIVLIVGAVKGINGMIIGGVIGLITSAFVAIGLMINNNYTVKAPVKVINIQNPLPDV